MATMQNRWTRWLRGTGLAITSLVLSHAAQARHFAVIHNFVGTDGETPMAGVIRDAAGDLYGTTNIGGKYDLGTVFKVTSQGTLTVLHSFAGGSDGEFPYAPALLDGNGDLFGTTAFGGGSSCGNLGCGTVFEIPAGGSEKTLYAFEGGTDGAVPVAGLIEDANGNLYGTTSEGGRANSGTVFRVAPGGSETVLYAFSRGSDGKTPNGALVLDGSGNLYGTTSNGGTAKSGTVFMLSSDGTESVLHSFQGGTNDGAKPGAGLLLDPAGDLYGTTELGGTKNAGTIFEMSNGTETVLHSFNGNSDGDRPLAPLIEDASGNLYGTTVYGGIKGNCGGVRPGCGVVFRLAPDGSETVLHRFLGHTDGELPFGGLAADGNGKLYSTAAQGGYRSDCCGNVFEIRE